jgi:protocatechuate 3,4-dioxygenase beta subunit
MLDVLEDRSLPASLSGLVFIDLNNDGFRQSAEPGLSGVAIALTGLDENNNAVSRNTTTGADGTFSFADLPAGTYSISQTQPTGFLDGSTSVGTAGGNAGVNVFTDIVLAADQLGADYWFAERGITVSGRVFNDADGDGFLDAGETGRAGVLLTLRNTGNQHQISVLSAADGSYQFENLAPGNYQIVPEALSGGAAYTVTTPIAVTITNSGAPGGVFANRNLGVSATSTLSGFVYVDANNNGIKDPGERGIAGVEIRLNGVQANSDGVFRTTTTGPDGSYRFENILPGVYSVLETQPANFLDGLDTAGTAGGIVGNDAITGINLPGGTTATGYNFGERERGATGRLSGTVYLDLNRDGLKQVNEPGLPNVVMILTGTTDDGPVTRSVTTGADGNYTFGDLAPGTYTITQQQPTNFLDGQDRVGTAGGDLGIDVISNIVVTSTTQGTGYDFGELGITVKGRVFQDTNANGINDPGEAGRAGVNLTLVGGGRTFSAIADANGFFRFDDIPTGNFTLTATLPEGVGATTTNPMQVNIPNDGVVGGELNGRDFGTVGNRGRLAGSVFIDANDDGIRQATEAGIAGVTIRLTGTQNNGVQVDRTATTAADGSYFFENLLPGTYTLQQPTQPANFRDGRDRAGTAGGIVGNDIITNIVLGTDFRATGYTFGEIRRDTSSSISGFVYLDLNRDGRQQASEPGLPNIVITLTGSNPEGPVELVTTTANDGSFTFANLQPGTYTITQTQPEGFADGLDSAGNRGGTVGNDVISNIVLPSKANATGYNFGELGITVRGVAFTDTNANGVRDPGEPVRGGVPITLRNASGSFVRTVTTAANGTYAFQNVPTGSFTLFPTAPIGTAVTTDAPLSVFIPTSGVVEGEIAEQDFGLAVATSRISGRVYLDLNGNGFLDPGERGIPGVTVSLAGVQANGRQITLTATTSPNGAFEFTGLLPGTYSLIEDQPQAFADGQDALGTAGGVLGNDAITDIVLGSATTATDYLFGELNDPFAVGLSGFAYMDVNRNGRFDAGDQGLRNVTLLLTGRDDDGNLVQRTTTTDSSGFYSFLGLAPGTYSIIQRRPVGLLRGVHNIGTLGGARSLNGFIKVRLEEGQYGFDYDLGSIRPFPSSKTFTASGR